MPKSDLEEETLSETQYAGPVDLLIGIAGAVNAGELQQQVQQLQGYQGSHVVIAYPGATEMEAPVQAESPFRLMPYSLPAADRSLLPWAIASTAQRTICAMAVEMGAKVCLSLHSDLATLDTRHLELFLQAIAEKGCDLVLPVYPSRKFEGLLNHSILAPLTRALYGQRVRFPLAPDFGCSAQMAARLSDSSPHHAAADGALLWPSIQAALSNYQVCQLSLDLQHAPQTEGLELSAILSSLVGSAFSEMETSAAYWQRIRASHPTATFGDIGRQWNDGEPVDTKPLIDSFLLGSRNLQEVWSLVLPPVTLLELKKMSRVDPASFRMPDEVWVRIVYDFALAYRLRTMNRGHLMGALAPLYLGWVASYAGEVAGLSPMGAEQRLEQLAKAYEENKPYLVSRWRWPDRFNP